MDERFGIYVDRLRGGDTEILSEEFEPDFLDVHESDLQFLDPVKVYGEAYLVESMLMMRLDISTKCTIPCAICNEPVTVLLQLDGCYHAIPLEEIKGGVFFYQELLREMVLLSVPNLAECEGGCLQREALRKYFKKQDLEKSSKVVKDEDGYRPFADLDLG